MLFHSAYPRFELADENAVADYGGMIFYDRAAKSDDLIASALVLSFVLSLHRQQVRPNVGPQGLNIGS
jgi:hypothetical protein